MTISPYERAILERFAASFPASAHYREGRPLRFSGWERYFPEITTDAQAKEAFLASVESLAAGGVVKPAWKRYRKGDVLDALFLLDSEKLYGLLGRPHPDSIRIGMLTFLDDMAGTTADEWMAVLQDHCRRLLENREPFPVAKAEELADVFRLAACTREAASGHSIRALSVRLFRDSKRIEKILPAADQLSVTATGEKLSARLGLERSYPESTIAGDGAVCFSDGRRWDLGGRIATLPLSTISTVARIEWPHPSPRILSIENKETFHLACGILRDRFDGFLYTSGQVNAADRALLALFTTAGASVFHFGDLDPGGLLIYSKIHEVTGGSVRPYLMDMDTYREYLPHGYSITPQAIKKLDSVTLPALAPLCMAMRETGLGIEQEVIDLRKYPGQFSALTRTERRAR
ncbi:MAG: DUF2399 domain-containing protein [Spirochaetales bacterium]|nr:DUF2399 domain-containing protein [Spirochaetales bacterium]